MPIKQAVIHIHIHTHACFYLNDILYTLIKNLILLEDSPYDGYGSTKTEASHSERQLFCNSIIV